MADEPKTVPAAKPVPAEKKEDAKPQTQKAEELASHKLLKEVKLTGTNGNGLQTLAVDPDGRVLALVAPRGYRADQKDVTSTIHILDADGKETGKLDVKFHVKAFNVGPDGTRATQSLVLVKVGELGMGPVRCSGGHSWPPARSWIV